MVTISVLLKPGAKKDAITINQDNSFTISVTSPPVEGKANLHLIKLLSEKLRLPKSSFEIKTGIKSRKKIITIDRYTKEDILKIINTD